MKKIINPFAYAQEICQATPGGILLTTKAGERVNTMTIGWGTLGTEWNKPVFTVYVRTGRFSHGLLEKNPEFTINVPMGSFDKKILSRAGTETGRKIDKIREYGLTLEAPEVITVPGIKEFPLTLECRVIYKVDQQIHAIHTDNVAFLYPQEVSNPDIPRNCEAHTAYYGEIVKAYIIE